MTPEQTSSREYPSDRLRHRLILLALFGLPLLNTCLYPLFVPPELRAGPWASDLSLAWMSLTAQFIGGVLAFVSWHTVFLAELGHHRRAGWESLVLGGLVAVGLLWACGACWLEGAADPEGRWQHVVVITFSAPLLAWAIHLCTRGIRHLR